MATSGSKAPAVTSAGMRPNQLERRLTWIRSPHGLGDERGYGRGFIVARASNKTSLVKNAVRASSGVGYLSPQGS